MRADGVGDAMTSALLDSKAITACNRLATAAESFMATIERVREHPDIQGSWGELLLRSLMATTEWTQMRHALKDYRKL